MGKLTISMAIFNSYVAVYQRVPHDLGNLHDFPPLILGPMPVGAVDWAPPAGDGGGYDQSYENYDAGGYGGRVNWDTEMGIKYPIGSMYGIYANIYHQYTPNVSIYTIHGSYGYGWYMLI